MSRSNWKGPFVNLKFLKKLNSKPSNSTQVFSFKKVWSRNSIIPKILTGKNVYVYNGKIFKKLTVLVEHIGFKFGDFCFTRKNSKKKIKKDLKKKKK